MRSSRNFYLRKTEASFSHGYPYTTYLQLSLIYGCGIYTATNQGILKKGQVFKNFWGHHYFDWILFARRSLFVGIVGGFLAGTVLFGDVDLATKRAISKWRYHTLDRISDERDSRAAHEVKLNN